MGEKSANKPQEDFLIFLRTIDKSLTVKCYRGDSEWQRRMVVRFQIRKEYRARCAMWQIDLEMQRNEMA